MYKEANEGVVIWRTIYAVYVDKEIEGVIDKSAKEVCWSGSWGHLQTSTILVRYVKTR